MSERAEHWPREDVLRLLTDWANSGAPTKAGLEAMADETCLLSTPKGEEVCRSGERSVASANAPGRDIDFLLSACDAAVRGWKAGRNEPLHQGMNALENAMADVRETLSPSSPWRSIDDMPEEIKRDRRPVLLAFPDGFVCSAEWNGWGGGIWQHLTGHRMYANSGKETHWMPLPEPPVQEETS